jgi:hypothetical protein
MKTNIDQAAGVIVKSDHTGRSLTKWLSGILGFQYPNLLEFMDFEKMRESGGWGFYPFRKVAYEVGTCPP